MRRGTLGAAIAAALSGCTCASLPGPVLTSVTPARVVSATDNVLAIRGSGFAAVVRADLDDPQASAVDAGFRVDLVGAAGRVPLSAVALLSDTELSGTLPAGAAPVGTYDVVLVDPRGRSASLPAGLDVVECLVEAAACEDGDLCTAGDLCVAGTCAAGGSVACPPPPPCQTIGTCDPATGACSPFTAVADGTPCNDGDPCTSDDACDAGRCRGPNLVCSTASNTPPLACLRVTPLAGVAGSTGATTFTLDASCSSDAEDDALDVPLTFRFDLDDGLGWTAPSPRSTIPVTYVSPGVHTVAVEVTDSGAPEGTARMLRAYAVRTIVAAAAADVVWVTTAADEEDPGATPSSPGGTGLSLREAIRYVNGLDGPTPLTGKVIAFEPSSFSVPASIPLSSRLPVLAGAGNAVVGLPGLTVDFAGAAQPASLACLTLGGDDQMLVGLAMSGCKDATVLVPPAHARVQVVDCTLAGPGLNAATRSVGIHVQTAATVARNDVSGFYAALKITVGRTTLVDGNRVHGNVTGISVRGADAKIVRNEVFRNAGAGLDVINGSQVVWFDVFDGNSGDGVHASGAVLDVRDDLFSENRGVGLAAIDCSFSASGPNGYFANGAGAVAGSAKLAAASDVEADPLYVSPPTADYRLLPASPAIDAGVDVGFDVNGPAQGLFDGARPDLGAHEYPRP